MSKDSSFHSPVVCFEIALLLFILAQHYLYFNTWGMAPSSFVELEGLSLFELTTLPV